MKKINFFFRHKGGGIFFGVGMPIEQTTEAKTLKGVTMGTKIVINRCYGGFSLSAKATTMLAAWGNPEAKEYLAEIAPQLKYHAFHGHDIARHDPLLVKVVETLGAKAWGDCSQLEIKEISGSKYIIKEYDGMESIREPHDIKWVEVS